MNFHCGLLTLKHSSFWFLKKTLKWVCVEEESERTVERNIFLAAGFYGAEVGGNIECAAAAAARADSHTTGHLSTYCSWQRSFWSQSSPAMDPRVLGKLGPTFASAQFATEESGWFTYTGRSHKVLDSLTDIGTHRSDPRFTWVR